MAHILIADNDSDPNRHLARLLRARGHRIDTVEGEQELVDSVQRWRPDLAILGLCTGTQEAGLRCLAALQEQHPPVPTIVISADVDAVAAVDVMRRGAFDFIGKPFAPSVLLKSIERALCLFHGRRPAVEPKLVGRSPALQSVMAQAARFAVPDINILLLGATGTGKEQFARFIHARSKRSGGPFVPVDCSALTESLFESEFFGHEKRAFTGADGARKGLFDAADGGTLFLDEIGNLPLLLQAKLLRVLQERRVRPVGSRHEHDVDVRILAATNVDLRDRSTSGAFREDLFYRLAEITLTLPTLHEHADDIRDLAEHFLALYAARFDRPVSGFTAAALAVLEMHEWPGNVRELESTIKSAVVLAESQIGIEHLPPYLQGPASCRDGPPNGESDGAQAPRRDHCQIDSIHVELDIPLNDQIDLKAIGCEASRQAEGAVLRELAARLRPSAAELARMVHVDTKTLRTKLRQLDIHLRTDNPRVPATLARNLG